MTLLPAWLLTCMFLQVLESIALMRMLGLNPVDKVRETLDEAIKVYERNAGRIGLSRLKTLMASLSIFKKDYRQAGELSQPPTSAQETYRDRIDSCHNSIPCQGCMMRSRLNKIRVLSQQST